MKKILKIFLVFGLVFTFAACGSKSNENEENGNWGGLSKDATVEELLEIYAEGFKTVNVEKMLSVYPEFARDYYAEYVTEENIRESLNYYGDNFEVSFSIEEKVKFNDEKLNDFNESIKKVFEGKNYTLASECYEIKGTTKSKGSKKENTGVIRELWYCNFGGTWKILED